MQLGATPTPVGVIGTFDIVERRSTRMVKKEKTLLIWLGAIALAMGVTACGNDDSGDPEPGADAGVEDTGTDTPIVEGTCTDGELNNGETAVDCGGPNCGACAESCSDGVMNQDETGVDCGGACEACPVADPTCDDGVMNGDEEGVDCGGSCADACPEAVTCTDTGEAGCETALDCPGARGDYTCDRATNCCIEVMEQCADDGQECSDDGQSTDRFICDTAAGLCMRRCDASTADDTLSEDCSTGSWCFPVTQNEGETEGVCLPGDCDSIFADEPCMVEGAAGSCFPVGHGASFCIPAGVAGVGEDCSGDVSCLSGLLCGPDQTCFEPCNVDDPAVGNDCGELDCVEALDNTANNPIGICGTACDRFSEGQCPDGEACEVMLGRGGLNGSLCTARPGTPVEDGETCSDDIPCMEGSICLNSGTEAAPELTCTQLCDTTGDELGDLATCAGDGEVCQPSAIDSLGFCAEGCEPYPRMGAGNYGCSEDGATCIPFDFDNGEWDDAQGACIMPFADTAYGEMCPDGADSNFTYGCEDLGLCMDLDGDATLEPYCRQMCDPFPASGVDECTDGEVCNRLFSLFGSDFGYCEDHVADAHFGQACTPAFASAEAYTMPCSDQGTLCIDLSGSGASCIAVCRTGHDEDCPEDTTCGPHGLNPDVIPDYVGLCN